MIGSHESGALLFANKIKINPNNPQYKLFHIDKYNLSDNFTF